MTELVAAVRHNDLAVVQRLCGLGADTNERCAVEPTVQRRHESPLYSTTPLFEAVRQRNKEVAAALLAQAEIDPNQTATELQLTPFCDAVSRGDLEMSAFLLRDARVDASLGSRVAAHPALYAAMAGNLEMLALFASHPAKLLPADDATLEQMLYATAAANGQKAALEYVQNYYIDSRPLGKLTPGRQLVKIRREFNKIDADVSGHCMRQACARHLPRTRRVRARAPHVRARACAGSVRAGRCADSQPFRPLAPRARASAQRRATASATRARCASSSARSACRCPTRSAARPS